MNLSNEARAALLKTAKRLKSKIDRGVALTAQDRKDLLEVGQMGVALGSITADELKAVRRVGGAA